MSLTACMTVTAAHLALLPLEHGGLEQTPERFFDAADVAFDGGQGVADRACEPHRLLDVTVEVVGVPVQALHEDSGLQSGSLLS